MCISGTLPHFSVYICILSLYLSHQKYLHQHVPTVLVQIIIISIYSIIRDTNVIDFCSIIDDECTSTAGTCCYLFLTECFPFSSFLFPYGLASKCIFLAITLLVHLSLLNVLCFIYLASFSCYVIGKLWTPVMLMCYCCFDMFRFPLHW